MIPELGRSRQPAPSLAGNTLGLDARTHVSRLEDRGIWAKSLRIISGTHALALADQAVVSGTSFLTMVMIGRLASPSELGVYALGLSMLIWLMMSQDSLITLPYTVQRLDPATAPAGHAGSSLSLSVLLSALATFLLAASAVVMSALDAAPALLAMTWALAAAAPFVLLREFARRFAFAHLHMGTALVLDSAVAATQLGILGWLAWVGWLSAVTAMAAIGASCGVVGGAWLLLARANFELHRRQLPNVMHQSWVLGRWLLATQLMVTMQVQVIYWLLAWIAGTTATGVYAACMSVASLANPLLLGSSNILNAKAALAFTEGGARLRRESIQDSLLLGAAMSLFCVLVLLVGEHVLQFLYPGRAYEGHGRAITVLALASMAVALGLPAWSALTSMGHTREVFWTGALGLAITVILAAWLVPDWGLPGAAYAFFGGIMARSAARWLVFLSLAARATDKRFC